MLIPFKDCVSIIGKVKNVLHIGAHHAEEASDYAKEGVEEVFWIDADFDLLDKIEEVSKSVGLKTSIVTGYAISNQDDNLVDLNVTNNGQSSSILELGTHKEHYPHIHVVQKKEVRTRKIKTLFEETKKDFYDVEFVNIDIQGAELLALQGFEDLLSSPSIKGIYLEINFEEVYKNCPLVDEIDEYLAKFGFFRKETSVTPYNWGDALYVRVPSKTVDLAFTNTTVNGPGKVVTNLLSGLKKLNVTVMTSAKNLGVLQSSSLNVLKHCDGKNVLIGPNVFVLPTDMPEVVERFDNFVVPSQWVKNLYEVKYPLVSKSKKETKIWSVGIDTQKWKPSGEAKSGKECFIYFKNRDEKDLQTLQKVFENQGYNVSVLRYGSYTEKELFDLCEKCSFCVLLDNTESQGIAIMEIMSMNVPLIVFDTKTWTDNEGKAFPATSVPYFDGRCGRVVSGYLSQENLQSFLQNVPNFNPRQYVLEHHTLVQAAGRYLECFK